MKYLSLSIPGFEKIDSPNASAPTGLPKGTPTGGLFDTGSNAIGIFIGVILIIAIFLSALWIIRGGFNMITSGGDKEKFTKGRERVRYAIIGLILIFLSFFFINILGTFFGVNLLSFYK